MLRQFTAWRESGARRPEELAEICLRRIAETESAVRAWVEVAPRAAPQAGPLCGVPFGVKDIYETAGMATEYGSPVYAGRKGTADAALVAHLEARGAILLGKTHTTAFAYFDPPPTRNPRDLRRTPGGSSSGSAAAVAAGMAAFALGTQTQGSVIRPAAFCGIVGFKPTFGRLPLNGVLVFAPSLDTAGLFTASAADMRELWRRGGWSKGVEAPPSRAAWFAGHPQPAALERLRAGGWRIDEMEPPEGFDGLLPAVRVINDYEGARTHRERWERWGGRLGPHMAAMVRRGLDIPEETYSAALECVRIGKQKMSALFEECPVVLTPAAPGPAPLGLASTGDARMNAPWTALGVPAITVPLVGCVPPLGLQMTAERDREDLLVAAAVEVEACLAP
jgi:Asp-tRNA(Asn)/Glu-tRNA(Gln) amidotransferase A subunit family amidase